MKKYLKTMVLAFVVGLVISTVLMRQYDESEGLTTVFDNQENVYFLKQGTYKSEDEMKNGLTGFKKYIYFNENNEYNAFVGISGNYTNATKMQGYLKEKGYMTSIEEYPVSSSAFLTVLNQYDTLLDQTSDNNVIEAICEQTISKYEEWVLNEHKN